VPNRLARERSPYLLQHAENPVDWYPWGEEAFAAARAADKPIFLSIGYSTCHWCHVMAHESFENDDIARLLNERFVPVKVDREERPDVDRVYMMFVQATTGAGGWPMSVWLTPGLKPFFGGTYFPPASRWGRPGFGEILSRIAEAWAHGRGEIEASADQALASLRDAVNGGAGAPPPGAPAGADTLALGVEQFQLAFDQRRGGFGDAPKFPRPSELLFLLGEHARTGDPRPRAMAFETLRAMALGGLRDHVGGGFHRYSVDADWRVPHFEKMLYDQAQLVLAYLEGAQAGDDALFAAVAEDTLDYVRRDLGDPAGGFYSAEDADSVPPELAGSPQAHKAEGAFYVWTDREIGEVTGADAPVVRLRFGVEPDGNAPSDPQGEFRGRNLLYTARTIDEVARAVGFAPAEVVAALGRARQALFDARARRPRPHLDDKILAAWNGLAIAAFARAARVLADAPRAARDLESARRAAAFVRAELWDERSRTLKRRHRDGEAAFDGYAEDYACLVWGLLELLQADGDAAWLDWALALQARQDELFWDEAGGGWFSTTGDDASVLLRLKEDYDGAEPAAGSVAALNAIKIAHLTGADEDDFRALWRAGGAAYLPFALVLPVRPGPGQDALAARLPWTAAMRPRDGRATAYVCRAFTCREPVTAPDALAAQLRSGAPV
jgi:uncharacterized protein YyaL (SSP411 family)